MDASTLLNKLIFYFIYFLPAVMLLVAPKNKIGDSLYVIASIYMLTVFSLYTGLREVLPNTDTQQYIDFYHSIQNDGVVNTNSRFNYGFLVLSWVFSWFMSSNVYILAISIIQSLLIFFVCKKVLRNNSKNIFFTIILFLTFFVTYNFSTNLLRQGIAVYFSLLAIHYLIIGNRLVYISYLAIAYLFHETALLFILAPFIIKLNVRYVYLIVGISSINYIFQFSTTAMKWLIEILGLTSEYSHILNPGYTIEYETGFKARFLIFSIFPIIVYISINRYLNDSYTKKFFKVYACIGVIYMYFGFMPFYDRLALYSWVFIPLLITLLITNLNNSHALYPKLYKYSYHVIAVVLPLLFVIFNTNLKVEII